MPPPPIIEKNMLMHKFLVAAPMSYSSGNQSRSQGSQWLELLENELVELRSLKTELKCDKLILKKTYQYIKIEYNKLKSLKVEQLR